MLKIFTNKKYLENLNGIDFPDIFFNKYLKNTKNFSGQDIAYIRKFEQAEVVEGGNFLNGRFKTQEQTDYFPLENMSSGVKTLLLLSLMQQGKIEIVDYINVTECGQNVLEEVFNLAERLDLPCVLFHIMFGGVSDRKYCLNNNELINTTIELINRIVEFD